MVFTCYALGGNLRSPDGITEKSLKIKFLLFFFLFIEHQTIVVLHINTTDDDVIIIIIREHKVSCGNTMRNWGGSHREKVIDRNIIIINSLLI
jgi:hypothetical protein